MVKDESENDGEGFLKNSAINVMDDADLLRWCRIFCCSEKDLLEAMSRAGYSASGVDACLTMNLKKGERKMRNRTVEGLVFDEETVDEVWEKAFSVPGFDPDEVRRDHCGALIKRDMFGKTDGYLSMGWEIDHIKPVSKGGQDVISNMQPLQWENNKSKGENHPYWDCQVRTTDEKYNDYLK